MRLGVSDLKNLLLLAFAAVTLQACKNDAPKQKPQLDVDGTTAVGDSLQSGVTESYPDGDARNGDKVPVNLKDTRFPRTALDTIPRVIEKEDTAAPGFTLRSSEVAMYNQLFDSLSLAEVKIRLVPTKLYDYGVGGDPSWDPHEEGRIYAEFLNNTIIIHGRDAARDDYAREGERLSRPFLMQLVACWQQKTDQPAAEGDQIKYTIDANKLFSDYTSAQQRAMISDYYFRFISDLQRSTRYSVTAEGKVALDTKDSDAVLKTIVEEAVPKAQSLRFKAEKRHEEQDRLNRIDIRRGGTHGDHRYAKPEKK